jgi:hypothetical protein
MLKKKDGAKGKAAVKGAGKPLRWSSGPAAARTFASGPVREGPGRDGGNAPEFFGARADQGFSPAALRQSLLIFYRTFAPDKEAESEGSLDDLLEVLLYYTSQRGMAALKAKLKQKYGKSLDDIALPDEVEDELEPEPPSEEDEPPPPVLSGHFEPVDGRPASGRTLPRTLSGASWNDLSDDMPPPPPYTPTSKGESEPRKSIPRGSDARSSNPRGSRRLLSLITGAPAAAPTQSPPEAAPAAAASRELPQAATAPVSEADDKNKAKRKSRMKSIFARKPLGL